MRKYLTSLIYALKVNEIRHTYEYWKNAMLNADLVCLDEIYDDSFLWTNSMGFRNDKNDKLKQIASGDLQYLSWENEDLAIHVVGNVATLKAREILEMKIYRQRVHAVQDVIALFIKRKGRWVLAAGQEIYSGLLVK
jgi:ketosteroid isomerase-like protein